MRFSILAAVAAFSSAALAQSPQDSLPKCAQTCFGNNTGSCGTADIACICGSSVITEVSCCVFATCSQADLASTISFASTFCRLAGVEVNTAPTCASGTSTPSAGNGTASATASSVSGASVSGATGSASRTSSSSAVASSGAAPHQTAGTGFSLGMAMAGLLAAL